MGHPYSTPTVTRIGRVSVLTQAIGDPTTVDFVYNNTGSTVLGIPPGGTAADTGSVNACLLPESETCVIP